jgi:peptidoglycan hydrolase-like protein with peptidoglycan-binding domain
VEPARVSEEGAEHRVLELTQPFTRGDDVRRLQAALNTRGYTNEPDGVFGSFTQALVKQFQKDQGLAADGVVGPVTWAALLQPLAAAAGNG